MHVGPCIAQIACACVSARLRLCFNAESVASECWIKELNYNRSIRITQRFSRSNETRSGCSGTTQQSCPIHRHDVVGL